MRSRFRAPALLASSILALTVAHAAHAEGGKGGCLCNCPPKPAAHAAVVHAPAHREARVVRHIARARRTYDERYAGMGYDYRSESRIDDSEYTHHWRIAPAGYVPPPPVAMAPPPPPQPVYGEGYGNGGGYGYRNGSLDNTFAGGVGYGAADEGGGGGGGVVTLAQPDSLNGPNYNSFGESYGGNYAAANRNAAWRSYNHINGSNGY